MDAEDMEGGGNVPAFDLIDLIEFGTNHSLADPDDLVDAVALERVLGPPGAVEVGQAVDGQSQEDTDDGETPRRTRGSRRAHTRRKARNTIIRLQDEIGLLREEIESLQYENQSLKDENQLLQLQVPQPSAPESESPLLIVLTVTLWLPSFFVTERAILGAFGDLYDSLGATAPAEGATDLSEVSSFYVGDSGMSSSDFERFSEIPKENFTAVSEGLRARVSHRRQWVPGLEKGGAFNTELAATHALCNAAHAHNNDRTLRPALRQGPEDPRGGATTNVGLWAASNIWDFDAGIREILLHLERTVLSWVIGTGDEKKSTLWTVLDSDEGGVQDPHTDLPSEHAGVAHILLMNVCTETQALDVLVQDGDDPVAQRIELPPGHYIIFPGNTPHRGIGRAGRRLHCYITPKFFRYLVTCKNPDYKATDLINANPNCF